MRTYETPGGTMWSVTTVLGACIPKPWLGAWVKKMAREAVLELISSHPDISKWDTEAQEEAIKHAINEHERVAKTALDIGSFIHNCLQIYYQEWHENI